MAWAGLGRPELELNSDLVSNKMIVNQTALARCDSPQSRRLAARPNTKNSECEDEQPRFCFIHSFPDSTRPSPAIFKKNLSKIFYRFWHTGRRSTP